MGIVFRRPAYESVKIEALAAASPEQLEAWRAEAHECDAYNRATEMEWGGKARACINLAAELWGDKSKVVAYLKKQGPGRWRPTIDFQRDVIERIKEHRKTEELAAFAMKRAAEEARKQERAILWLLARGKKLGEDFTLDGAVHMADEIAYHEEIDKRAAEGGFYDFSGKNCDGPCEGWDGLSRRCECGNRRVGWSRWDSFDFENPAEGIYAEAW